MNSPVIKAKDVIYRSPFEPNLDLANRRIQQLEAELAKANGEIELKNNLINHLAETVAKLSEDLHEANNRWVHLDSTGSYYCGVDLAIETATDISAPAETQEEGAPCP